jgi:CRP/FNR family transcriptional regulator, cyclic AMP receptor protein
MLSTLERVLTLKSVSLFSATPDEVLIEIAALLHEVQIVAGATIFAEGDVGTSMYIIVSGRVQVFDNKRILAELGSRAVFGELALLDPEPRLASVRALEDTLLLRVDHRPFYELMAHRPEIAYSIIYMLGAMLRDGVADLNRLRV